MECVCCAIRTESLNIRSAHTVYLCVLCGSQNKQPLFPYTALTDSVFTARYEFECNSQWYWILSRGGPWRNPRLFRVRFVVDKLVTGKGFSTSSFLFLCQYLAMSVPYMSSPTCCAYKKDKWRSLGTVQKKGRCFGNRGASYRRIFSLIL
jgi:hypothetical protein